jgi:hypothetical protein
MNTAAEKDIPVFKKWSHWYVAVILFELLLILLFCFITNHFA